MSRISVFLVSFGLASVLTTPAVSQSFPTGWSTDVRLSVGGIFPSGNDLGGEVVYGEPSGVDVAGGAKNGYTFLATVDVGPVGSPLSLRVEGQYSTMRLEDDDR